MRFPKRVRRRVSSEERHRIVEAYRGCGLTQREFAGRAGVGLSTLAAWLRRAEAGREPAPAFVAVPNLVAAGPPPAYRLQWPGGPSLEVRPGFDPAELASLVRALRDL